ncbi:MAG: 3-phosphoserine/phosphohydroxythreonine transaminase [Dethiobacteria bacterium]|jgi:phosphoserine aminotransferase|nr:3-phosphoserine/phosphohydroxythreonine transaminase [Bacillota bacterium]
MTKDKRVYNFYPGPATLPLSVLEKARMELTNYRGTGMSVMEMSHRSAAVEELITSTEKLLLELLELPAHYRVLFLQGGASTQFYMVPLNFLPEGKSADYLVTGNFAEKAFKEAAKIGRVRAAADTKGDAYRSIPKLEDIKLDPEAAYLHLTSNNTVYGTQWREFPCCGDIPLICDASSDILSRRLDFTQFVLIYAGAQKNLGPAGTTVVVIREDLLEKVPQELPSMLRYDIHAAKNSLYNTPSIFAIYMVNLVLNWLKDEVGGLEEMEKINRRKAKLIYDEIDQSNGFYRGYAAADSRSLMNVTFRLPEEELEKKFVAAAEARGLVGLKGYRTVGGIRASIYNAMPIEGCDSLAEFMREFREENA